MKYVIRTNGDTINIPVEADCVNTKHVTVAYIFHVPKGEWREEATYITLDDMPYRVDVEHNNCGVVKDTVWVFDIAAAVERPEPYKASASSHSETIWKQGEGMTASIGVQ